MNNLYIPSTAISGRNELETIDAPMPHHLRGLSYTASGYGDKIPTTYKVKFNNRWHRVYCRIFSNCGSLYIVSKKAGNRFFCQSQIPIIDYDDR